MVTLKHINTFDIYDDVWEGMTPEEKIEKINKKIDFMLQRMDMMIDERINIKLGEKGFEEFLVMKTKAFMHARIDDMVRLVVAETVARMNKNINEELKITKALCQSIDSEIKHTIREMDCSYEGDKKIETLLGTHIQKFLTTDKRGKKEIKFLIKTTEREEDKLGLQTIWED